MSYEEKLQLLDASKTPFSQYWDETTQSFVPAPNPAIKQSKTTSVTLQNASTTPSNGTAFEVLSYKTLTIEITGTSTSSTIQFEGCGASNVYTPIIGIKLADISIGTSTTGKSEIWRFPITGLTKFRARIASISGGNISIVGVAVA